MIKRGWRVTEQAYFMEKMGVFLARGYSLTEAVHLLQFQQNQQRREQLQAGLEMLESGNPIYEVLQQLRFQQDVISYLFFAEAHGDLGFACNHAGKMLRKKQELQQRMSKLATYPLFLLFLLLLLFIFVETMLMPQFHHLYSSMDVQFSTMIQFLFTIPNILIGFGYFLAVITVIVLLFFYSIYPRISPTKRMTFMVRFPFLSSFFILKNTHYFCLQLGSLLKGGLSINDALAIFEMQSQLPFFREEGLVMKKLLLEGESFAEIIERRPYYENDLPQVISHAQAHGRLAKELSDFSELVLERLESKVKRAIEITHPILLVIIGVFLVTLYLSVMLPLFGMVEGL